MSGTVVAVSRSPRHRFSKDVEDAVVLVEGLGVQGDAHAGPTVQHLSRVAVDPTQPNLRQVHLIAAELHTELGRTGHDVAPGHLGENLTTTGVDLLGLPRGARLRLGPDAAVEITGLRNPCAQIDRFRPGLLREVVRRALDGGIERRAGVMGIVISGGTVRAGDAVEVRLPAPPHAPLAPV